MEVGSKGWQKWGLDNSSQFLIDQSWNRKCAWWYPAGTGRNFNIDVGHSKRVEKGRFLLGSIALLILSCHIEALQIFKLEIGVKKDIVYKMIDLSIWFSGCARVLPVHKHFDWFILMNRGWGWWPNKYSISPSNSVKVLFGNKGVRNKGRPVKEFLQ